MSIVYLIALIGVAAMLLMLCFESLRSVAVKPVWQTAPAYQPKPALQLAEYEDRRTQDLPFVGKERRRDRMGSAVPEGKSAGELRKSA